MTINRRLRERNLRARRPLRCLPLTPVHRQVRLQWCRERSTWNCADWGRIVFSDESRFLLCPDDRRKRVWRRPGQRVDPGLTVEHHTGPQQGVMVWGAISFDSRTPLVVIPGTLTAQRYVVDDILRPVLLPFLSHHPVLTFQQDNARPHTARVTMDFLQSCRTLLWPARSPDLSPIEHIWDVMGRRLQLSRIVDYLARQSIDQNPTLGNFQKLQYLNSALKENAARLIRAFNISDENYPIAWQTLVNRFDKKSELAFKQIQNLYDLKNVKQESTKDLLDLLDTCNESIQNLSILGLERNNLSDMILIHIIQSKLDRSIRKEWEMSLLEKEYPSYEKMVSFLERFAGSLGSFQNKENSKQFYKMNKSTHSHSATFASGSSIDSRVKSCVLCKGEHFLLKCPKFNGMMLPERWTFVKDNRLCYNCLRSNHRVSSCVFTQNCKSCNKRHHTLLHQFKPEMLSPVADISPLTHASVSCFADNKSHDRILLSTALIKVKSENGITSELPNFFIEKDNWPYLKNLLLTDPNFDKSSQIDLVIGAELAPCLFNGKVRFQNLSGPTACGSKLGWLLTGKILLSGENSNQDITMFASEEQDDFLKKFWELESVPSAKSLTREEISINALKRFLSLERKLQKSPNILKQYCDFMDEYILINHMELIPSDELDTPSGQCYYIPHHCVFKEQSTTTKLRVVFDASCKTSNDKSLNDFLHVGPKLQQDIFNILIRFRTRPIAFSGVIEKMYRQVRIDSRDCDFQRILWRKKPSEPFLDYRLLTVTYGLSCAPYLAMRTLHQLARDKVSTFPVASKIVQTDFYVDDLLSGADTIEEATCHIREVNNLLSSAEFSLRKWRSNVPEILSGFSEQVEDRHNLRDFESDSCVKILGICWNPSLDIFQILVNDIPEQTNSKKHLLSHISRIFDPIGWLSPVIIRLKILLQSLWKQKLNWDDPLPDTLCSQWKKIEKELSVLNKIKILRYFSCRGALLSLELHGFCDSSEVAYAAVF
ncbi:hypothetical protein LAZ67_17001487 [Cordylochernes scorpioides]|uniref:Tc1-like transposase DDE domain-containing protein n=1 Tax=Cordylochernes scorpioides TaxID=51811 RepID=A0ABY6LI97_9ARAC|nr:hypothetical protein LAZ67_17001487 [Cordylochernes scorpioides]